MEFPDNLVVKDPTAVVRVRSLTREILHAVDVAKYICVCVYVKGKEKMGKFMKRSSHTCAQNVHCSIVYNMKKS